MYNEKNLVRVAKRENNKKRNYLVINRFQAKHMPASPKHTFTMFHALAETVKKTYENENLLIIGFAETATAIGSALAIELKTLYMQTTREVIPGVSYFHFSEEHSHATEQKLIREDLDKVISKVDRIIFAEDELTTGNTILNIVNLLEKTYPDCPHFAVASLLNGMDESNLAKYRERKIALHYLVKTNQSLYPAIAEGYQGDGEYVKAMTQPYTCQVNEVSIPGWMNARRCIDGEAYDVSCKKLWDEIQTKVSLWSQENQEKKRIVVIGTEEFMYPALYAAYQLEKQGNYVKCHSTTRSPIEVSKESHYPLHKRNELRSLYDKERVTYLYDLDSYDLALVLTDSQSKEKDGFNSLVHALETSKVTDIVAVRWCKL